MAMVDNRPGSAEKLGILLYTVLEKCVEMDIYLADLDKFSCKGGGIVKEYPPIHHPALRFQAPVPERNYPTFCVHNSTLYMFDGYNPLIQPWFPPLPLRTKSAYKSSATLLDLSAQLKEKEKEEESRQQLVKMSSMNHAKGFPVALPTPDGKKILVFSTHFIFARSDEAFELYDPREGSFVTLPKLPLPHTHTDPECDCRICDYDSDDYDPDDCDEFVLSDSHDVEEVVSYCFIGDSHFLLEMEFQVYAFDLRDGTAWAIVPRRGVLPLHDPNQGFRDIHKGYFETFMGRYALIPGVEPVSEFYGPDLRGAELDLEVALYVHDVGNGRFLRPPSDEVTDGGGFFRPTYDKFLVSHMVLPGIDRWICCSCYILPADPAPTGIQKNGESESVCSCNTYVVQQATRFDCEEFRLLIDVCRTDFTSTHTKTSILKSASLSVCSNSELLRFAVCFTL